MATNSDGSVIIGVDLSLSQAEKKLQKLEGDIDKTGEKINDLTNKRERAESASGDDALKNLEAEKAKLAEMESTNKRTVSTEKKLNQLREKAADTEAQIAEAMKSRDTILGSISLKEKGIESLKRKISELELSPDQNRDEIAFNKKNLTALGSNLSKDQADLGAAERKISDLTLQLKDQQDIIEKNALSLSEGYASSDIDKQKENVKQLSSEYRKAQSDAKKYGDQIINANMELDKQKAETGQLAAEIDRANTPAERFKNHMRQTGENVEKLDARLKRLASRVMIFSVFTMGLRELRKWMMSAIKTNDEARQSIAQLKGALLTMVQPLLNVVIPAFITLVRVMTNVVTTIAKVVSSIFGGTVEQSAEAAENLNEEQKALKGVGSEAKKAGKSLASFDEINQISDTSGEGGGGGGGADAEEILPDFSFMDSISNELKERLDEIAKVVLFIGTGFALWKISEHIPGLIGEIGTKLGGLAIAAGGVVLTWDGMTDAWDNGVDWLNMAEMIGGVALAAWGLYAAFGSVGGGIALVVGGLAILATGFHDAMENGWNLQNTLLTMAGIFATGLGISLLTGGPIPALIGAIGAVLLALTVATGHGEELIQGIQGVVEGFATFFKGIFTGDLEMAAQGIIQIFESLDTAVGAVVDAVKDSFLWFFDWLDEKTGGKFHDIIETAKITVEWLSTSIHEILDGIVEFITGVFTLDWKSAWDGLVKVFDGIIGTLATPFVAVVNLIIDALNTLIRGMNKISFKAPDWVPGIGGKSFGININQIPKVKVPALAQGAVIPPNREFLAVLGDQTNGTNIEAPLSTIEEAVTRAMSAAGAFGGRDMTVILQLDRRELARTVYKLNNEETQRVGVRLVGGLV